MLKGLSKIALGPRINLMSKAPAAAPKAMGLGGKLLGGLSFLTIPGGVVKSIKNDMAKNKALY